MNVLSCFDGMACGRLALERAGIQVDRYYAFEIDKYAIKVATTNYPDIVELGDINNWESYKNIEIPDIILAGFPCQSYSVAGKGKGLDDKRGKLIYPMLDMINHFKPSIFLLENVKGLMSARNWYVFQFILSELSGYGYAVDWCLINSSLVSAQNRERVYIIGKRLDTCQGKVYTYDLGDYKNEKRKKNNNRDDDNVC
jgi:DNA-cytosine methyltransferase